MPLLYVNFIFISGTGNNLSTITSGTADNAHFKANLSTDPFYSKIVQLVRLVPNLNYLFHINMTNRIAEDRDNGVYKGHNDSSDNSTLSYSIIKNKGTTSNNFENATLIKVLGISGNIDKIQYSSALIDNNSNKHTNIRFNIRDVQYINGSTTDNGNNDSHSSNSTDIKDIVKDTNETYLNSTEDEIIDGTNFDINKGHFNLMQRIPGNNSEDDNSPSIYYTSEYPLKETEVQEFHNGRRIERDVNESDFAHYNASNVIIINSQINPNKSLMHENLFVHQNYTEIVKELFVDQFQDQDITKIEEENANISYFLSLKSNITDSNYTNHEIRIKKDKNNSMDEIKDFSSNNMNNVSTLSHNFDLFNETYLENIPLKSKQSKNFTSDNFYLNDSFEYTTNNLEGFTFDITKPNPLKINEINVFNVTTILPTIFIPNLIPPLPKFWPQRHKSLLKTSFTKGNTSELIKNKNEDVSLPGYSKISFIHKNLSETVNGLKQTKYFRNSVSKKKKIFREDHTEDKFPSIKIQAKSSKFTSTNSKNTISVIPNSPNIGWHFWNSLNARRLDVRSSYLEFSDQSNSSEMTEVFTSYIKEEKDEFYGFIGIWILRFGAGLSLLPLLLTTASQIVKICQTSQDQGTMMICNLASSIAISHILFVFTIQVSYIIK